MRILYVAAAPPWPLRNGGALRTYHLLKSVASHAEIDLVCIARPDAAESEAKAELARVTHTTHVLPRSRASVAKRISAPRRARWFHSQALREHVRAQLERGGYDVVHLDEAAQLSLLPHDLRVPLVAHHHKLDLDFARAFSRGRAGAFDAWKTAREERSLVARARLHVVCCAEDADRLRARHPRIETRVVPNGVDVEALGPPPPFVERDVQRVLFLGALDYPPNIDALAWYARSIHPLVRAQLPGVTLEVVGSGPRQRLGKLLGAGTSLLGELSDVRGAFARAGLLVVPLRVGGGTRLKLYEAAALGCPIVTTPIGAEGSGLRDAVHVRCASDSESFARTVLDVLGDRVAARALADAAREHVRVHATWESAGRALLDAWRAASAAR